MILEANATQSSLLVVEAGMTLIAMSLAYVCPNFAADRFATVEKFVGKLAKKRAWSITMVAVLACVLRLAVLPAVPVPEPYIHDEFSYLLAGDTFAAGRLTNPTHPMWPHFESFHITLLPTYMSMYFPGQGLFLAAGQVLFGHPWFGVLISAGIFCGSLYWMLLGWLPPGWALFGGLLAVCRLALFSYWVNSYDGGFVAAIGGTLVLGALPRLRRSFGVRNALWMALGFAILANTRPFEGLLVSLPAVAMLLWWRLKQYPLPGRLMVRRMAAPAALLMLTAAGMAYYNYRVFGNPFTIPYQVNRTTYASAPHFLWQKPRPEPIYRHKVMRDFYTNWELADFNYARTLFGFIDESIRKFGITIFFVFGFALMPPLLLLPRTIRDQRVRYLVWGSLVFGAGILCNAWLFPHYLAPFFGGMYVILLQCMRHLRARSAGPRPWGTALVRSLAVTCLLLVGIRILAAPLGIATERWPTSWYGTKPLGLTRAAIKSYLESLPGKQLVLVRYSPTHAPFIDWVYNAADIDRSKVVWAREMDAPSNAALLRYFADRQVWLVEPDSDTPAPVPLALADRNIVSQTGLKHSVSGHKEAERDE